MMVLSHQKLQLETLNEFMSKPQTDKKHVQMKYNIIAVFKLIFQIPPGIVLPIVGVNCGNFPP